MWAIEHSIETARTSSGRTTHRIARLERERSRIIYAMEITGSEADRLGPHIGPEISADFPDVLAALVKMAEC
jgi:hypothetical protein